MPMRLAVLPLFPLTHLPPTSSCTHFHHTFKTLCASNPCAINHFRTLCKIPGIGYPPPSLFFDSFFAYSFRINTCKSVSKQMTLTPFRMNTYEKQGGGGWRPVFLFLARDKSQGCGIHAVAQACGLRAVREDVAQVRITERAFHFRAHGAVAEVFPLANIFFCDGRPETRPARAGIEFRAGIEERIAAADAAVESRGVLIVKRSRVRPLRGSAPRDIELQRAELLLPLRLALLDFRERRFTQPCSVVGKLHDRHWARVVIRRSLVRQRGKTNSLHAEEQPVSRDRRRPVNETPPREIFHRVRYLRKNT